MVILSLHTGLRRGELFSLTWGAIDHQVGTLTVRADTSKSSRKRVIPMNAKASVYVRHLFRHRSSDGLIFANSRGKRFSDVKRSWGRILDEAEIRGFRWHDLRHSFASKLAMAGVDLVVVRDLLGHADFRMTLRYAHLAPSHMAAAVERLVTQ
jgi:integrase